MNLLMPPADSLYKFIGVSGVLILIASIVFISYGAYREDDKLTFAENELQYAESNISEYFQELNYQRVSKGMSKNGMDSIQQYTKSNIWNDAFLERDSNFYKLYFSIPDSIRAEINELRHQYAQKQIALNSVRERSDVLMINFNSMAILGFFGLFIGGMGLALWYYRVQLPIDIENQRRYEQSGLKGDDFLPNCQSCFTTILFPQERGVEHEGRLSPYFCRSCYHNGNYIEPELSYDEALDRFKNQAKIKGFKTKQIKRLENQFTDLLRWKRERTL